MTLNFLAVVWSLIVFIVLFDLLPSLILFAVSKTISLLFRRLTRQQKKLKSARPGRE